MTVKQLPGTYAPDGSLYITLTDGNGNLVATAEAIDAKSLGAVGDGITDDTSSLQAAINYCLTNKKRLYIPAGKYKITSTLNVGSTGSNTYNDFMMVGDGGGPLNGGTSIVYYGSSINSIISINKEAFRRFYFSDFAVIANTPGAATYGILFPTTEFSQHSLERIYIRDVGTAIGVLAGTGMNGEFLHFQNIYAQYVNAFWYNNSGQSYVHSFKDCVCFLNSGGSYFVFDMSTNGGGLHVDNFNGTIQSPPSVSNTTLVENRQGGQNSVLNFRGGRVEHLTQLYKGTPNSIGLRAAISIQGMQITTDNVAADGTNTKLNFIDNITNTDLIKVQSCKVVGTLGTETITTNIDNCHVEYNACIFENIATNPGASPPTNVVFTKCLYVSPGASTVGTITDQGNFSGPYQLSRTILDSATNTSSEVLKRTHTSSGTTATGFGIDDPYYLQNASGNTKKAAFQTYKWSDPTDGAEFVQVDFNILKNGVSTRVMHISDDGSFQWTPYYSDTSGTRNPTIALNFPGVVENSGAGIVTTNLPDPSTVPGRSMTFCVTGTGGQQINAVTGKKIYFGAAITAASGNIKSIVIGSSVTVVGDSSGNYFVDRSTGTWVVT